MTSVTATAARRDLYNLIAQVNEECKPVTISNTKGKSAVLIGEDDWSAIEETLYLDSIPGMSQSLLEAAAAPASELVTADALEW